jgi:hypothetical protein
MEQELEAWAEKHYRPVWHKLLEAIGRRPLLWSPVLLGGLLIVKITPAAALEPILFRKRDEDTRRIAREFGTHADLGT